MLDNISVPHIFTMFLYHFGMIYETNLLTIHRIDAIHHVAVTDNMILIMIGSSKDLSDGVQGGETTI